MSQNDFASALKAARKAAGLTQMALGRMAGLTGSYISMLEKRRRPPPSETKIRRIAKALDMPAGPLLEIAALERAPRLRRHVERIDRERTAARRDRDRLLTTSLFHAAHRKGVLNPYAAFLDLPPGQRTLLGQLIGRFRRVKSVTEAEERAEELLEDTAPEDRALLVQVVPDLLSTDEADDKRTPAPPPAPTGVPVHAHLDRSDPPSDHWFVDPRHAHEEVFFYAVGDDTGWPRIEQGDLLLVDPISRARPGDWVAFRHRDADHVRSFHPQGDQVRLESLGRDAPPIRMPARQFTPIGVVIWQTRSLR